MGRFPETRRDTGAAAVEFAILLPVLLLIVFGLINFGVVFSQQLSMNNAVREGARNAVVAGSVTSNQQCAGIVANVRGASDGLGLDSSAITFRVSQSFNPSESCSTPSANPFAANYNSTPTRVPCNGAGVNDSITVETRYPAKWLIPFPPFSGSIQLSAKAVYRCEFSG